MRILFINHTFPGDLGPLLAAFAAQPGHEILFASCRGRRDFSVPGVRHVVLSPSRSRRLAGDGAGTVLDRAVETGRQTLQAFRLLRQSGFVPDMVLLSSALEQGLFLRDAFPDTFAVCFAEGLPSDGLAADGRGLVRHLLQCRQMRQSDLVIRLAAEAESRDLEQRGVVTLPYPVDTDYFAPAGDGACRRAEGDGQVLCAVRDAADAGRLLRLAENLLDQRPECRLTLLCESATGRERLAALATALPPGVSMPERLSLRAYRDLLRTAAAGTGTALPRGPGHSGAAFPAAGCHPRASGPAACGTDRMAAEKAGRHDGLRRRRAWPEAGRGHPFLSVSPGRDAATTDTADKNRDGHKKDRRPCCGPPVFFCIFGQGRLSSCRTAPPYGGTW